MKTKSTACLRRSRRAGHTLIEVLAAIAILGTILVGVVLAKSRHTRQIERTQRQNAAVRAADELIAGWWASSRGVPVGDSGVTASDASLAWKTHVVANREIEDLGARVVRVEIRIVDGKQEREPLVTVDLVLSDPDRGKERPNE